MADLNGLLQICRWEDATILFFLNHLDVLVSLKDASHEDLQKLFAGARREINQARSLTIATLPKFVGQRPGDFADLRLPDLPYQASSESTAWQDPRFRRTFSSASSQTAMSAQTDTDTNFKDIDMLETQSLEDEFHFSTKAMIVRPSVNSDSICLPYLSDDTLFPFKETAVELLGLQPRSMESEDSSLSIQNVPISDNGNLSERDTVLGPIQLAVGTIEPRAKFRAIAMFTCPFCHTDLSSESVFRTHILEFHKAQCTFRCNHCPKAYTLPKRFKDHHREYHGDCLASAEGGSIHQCSQKEGKPSKTYIGCGFCGCGYDDLRAYLKHLAKVHAKAGSENAFHSKDRVVVGLLKRPGVAEAWLRLSNSSCMYSWPKPGVDQLIEDLELGRPNEAVLAGGANSEHEQLAYNALSSAIITGNEMSAIDTSEGTHPVPCVLRPATRRLRSRLSFGGRRAQKSKRSTGEEVAAAKAEASATTLSNLQRLMMLS